MGLLLVLTACGGINSSIATHNDRLHNIGVRVQAFDAEVAEASQCVAEAMKLDGVGASFEDHAATRIQAAQERMRPVREFLATDKATALTTVPDEKAVDEAYIEEVRTRSENIQQIDIISEQALDEILDVCGREYEEFVRVNTHGNSAYGYQCKEQADGTYIADPAGDEWCYHDSSSGGGHYYYRSTGSNFVPGPRTCWKCDTNQPVSNTPGYRTNTQTVDFINDDSDLGDRAYTGRTIDLRKLNGGGATIRHGTGGSVSSGRGGGK